MQEQIRSVTAVGTKPRGRSGVISRRGQWVPAVVLVAGLVVTVFAAWMVNSYLTRGEVAEATVAGDHAAASVRLFLERAANAVRAVRAMYAAGDVTEDQFRRFAQTLSVGQDVSAIGFVRRVEEPNRKAYEATLTGPPGSTIGIWEADANGKVVASPPRPVHLVLEATSVPGGLPPSYGFDAMSLPDRAGDMLRALDRFQLTMSGEIPLAAMNDVGVTLFDPVVDRNSRPIGLAAASISHQAIVDAAAKASGVSDITLDIGAPGTGEVQGPDSGKSRSFAFADRLITVGVKAPPVQGVRPWVDLLVIALGLAATAAVIAALFNREKTLELHAAERRLRGMLDGLGPIAILLAPDGTVVQANQAAVNTFQRPERDMLRHPFEELLASGDDDDKERLHHAIAAAGRGEDARFDMKLESSEGRQVFDVWIRRKELTGNLVASAVDVTDRYEAEETQRLLMRELDHRMKNTLQVIQAIIRRTATTQASIAKFEEALLGRVGAMSRAHDLLANERWHGADITAVVRQETEHLGGQRAVTAAGPHIRLNPKAALSLALVIHELGTNAVKYGSLSATGGRVEITWNIDRSQREPRLMLTWQESNGPAVLPATHRGFGSLLIERSIAYELDGTAQLNYRSEGLICVISAPLRAVRPFLSHPSAERILAAQ